MVSTTELSKKHAKGATEKELKEEWSTFKPKPKAKSLLLSEMAGKESISAIDISKMRASGISEGEIKKQWSTKGPVTRADRLREQQAISKKPVIMPYSEWKKVTGGTFKEYGEYASSTLKGVKKTAEKLVEDAIPHNIISYSQINSQLNKFGYTEENWEYFKDTGVVMADGTVIGAGAKTRKELIKSILKHNKGVIEKEATSIAIKREKTITYATPEHLDMPPELQYVISHASPNEAKRLENEYRKELRKPSMTIGIVGPVARSTYSKTYEEAFKTMSKEERAEYNIKYLNWNELAPQCQRFYEGSQEYFATLSDTEKSAMVDKYKQSKEWKDYIATQAGQKMLNAVVETKGTNNDLAERDMIDILLFTPPLEHQVTQWDALSPSARNKILFQEGVTSGALAIPILLQEGLKHIGVPIPEELDIVKGVQKGYVAYTPAWTSATVSQAGKIITEGKKTPFYPDWQKAELAKYESGKRTTKPTYEEFKKTFFTEEMRRAHDRPFEALVGTAGEALGLYAGAKPFQYAWKVMKPPVVKHLIKPGISKPFSYAPKVLKKFETFSGISTKKITGIGTKISKKPIMKTAQKWSKGYELGRAIPKQTTKFYKDKPTGVEFKRPPFKHVVYGRITKYAGRGKRIWMSPHDIKAFKAKLRGKTGMSGRVTPSTRGMTGEVIFDIEKTTKPVIKMGKAKVSDVYASVRTSKFMEAPYSVKYPKPKPHFAPQHEQYMYSLRRAYRHRPFDIVPKKPPVNIYLRSGSPQWLPHYEKAVRGGYGYIGKPTVKFTMKQKPYIKVTKPYELIEPGKMIVHGTHPAPRLGGYYTVTHTGPSALIKGPSVKTVHLVKGIGEKAKLYVPEGKMYDRLIRPKPKTYKFGPSTTATAPIVPTIQIPKPKPPISKTITEGAGKRLWRRQQALKGSGSLKVPLSAIGTVPIVEPMIGMGIVSMVQPRYAFERISSPISITSPVSATGFKEERISLLGQAQMQQFITPQKTEQITKPVEKYTTIPMTYTPVRKAPFMPIKIKTPIHIGKKPKGKKGVYDFGLTTDTIYGERTWKVKPFTFKKTKIISLGGKK